MEKEFRSSKQQLVQWQSYARIDFGRDLWFQGSERLFVYMKSLVVSLSNRSPDRVALKSIGTKATYYIHSLFMVWFPFCLHQTRLVKSKRVTRSRSLVSYKTVSSPVQFHELVHRNTHTLMARVEFTKTSSQRFPLLKFNSFLSRPSSSSLSSHLVFCCAYINYYACSYLFNAFFKKANIKSEPWMNKKELKIAVVLQPHVRGDITNSALLLLFSSLAVRKLFVCARSALYA